jgi:GT2 family glycosyltransferase
MNAGLARLAAQGCEQLLLLNNDAVLEPGCLRLLSEALDDPALAAAGPVIVRAADGRVESAGLRVDLRTGRVVLEGHGCEIATLGLGSGRRDAQALSGAVIMISAVALERVGPLDEETFFSFEDVDWCLRARLAGYRLAVIGGARARHIGGLSMGRRSSDRLYYATRNHLRLVERHQTLGNGARWLRRAMVLSLNLGHALRQRAVARPAAVRAVFEGFLHACRAGGKDAGPARRGQR